MEKLKQIIVDKVFDSKNIRKISENSSLVKKENQWMMDFKSVSMSEEFLSLFVEEFDKAFIGKKVQVGGMESGAIPLIVALRLKSETVCNSFYVRKSRKKSDMSNFYEGEILKSVPIVLVDDVLNTGATFLKQEKILNDEGHSVNFIFSVIRFRDEKYYKEILEKNIDIISIFELSNFKNELGTENILDINNKLSIPKDKFKVVWGKKLTEYYDNNFYTIIPKSGIVLDEDSIYTGCDDGSFYSVSKSDGSMNWKYKIKFGVKGKNIFSTPAQSEKYVFFGAYDGNLYCLDKKDGKVIWVFFDADYIGASPWVENNKYVYIGLEFGFINKKGGVAKIEIKTGKKVWCNYEMSGLTHASPVSNVKLNIVVCGCNDNFVYCFDRKSGELLWKYKTEGEVKYGCVFDEKRKLVIIAGMDGGVYLINVKTGELYHKFEAMFGFYSNPVIKDDTLYIGSLDKRVYAFDIKNKVVKWEHKTGGRIFASPTIFDNSLFIGSNDGNLYELDLVSGKEISITIFSERIVNKIIAVKENNKNILYVKTFLNQLYKMEENKNLKPFK